MRDITALQGISASLTSVNLAQIQSAVMDEDADYLGWIQGNNLKNTVVEVIFDYMCPGSRLNIAQIGSSDENPAGESLIDILNASMVESESDMTYMDAIKLKLAPFPYYMHPHAHEDDQVLFFLKDLCDKDPTKCYMNEFMMLSFENQDQFAEHGDDTTDEFAAWWASVVAARFDGVEEADIIAIYGDDDALNTWDKVEDLFDYGDGLNFEHLPALLINGVLLEGFPDSKQAWLDTIAS